MRSLSYSRYLNVFGLLNIICHNAKAENSWLIVLLLDFIIVGSGSCGCFKLSCLRMIWPICCCLCLLFSVHRLDTFDIVSMQSFKVIVVSFEHDSFFDRCMIQAKCMTEFVNCYKHKVTLKYTTTTKQLNRII